MPRGSMGIFQVDISIIWIADWNLQVGKSIPESKSKVEHVFFGDSSLFNVMFFVYGGFYLNVFKGGNLNKIS